MALLFQGRFAEAEAALREALEMSEAAGDLYQAGWYTGMLGQLIATRDGPLPALRLLAEGRARFEEHLDPVYLEAEAVALHLRGDPRRALEHHSQVASLLATHGFRGAWNLALAAWSAAELGEVVAAEGLAERARALIGGREVFVQSKGVRLATGRVLCCLGDGSGLGFIDAAVQGLRDMGARPWLVFALCELADARRELDPDAASQAEAAFQAAASSLAGPLPAALRAFGTKAGTDALEALGCAALHARSLEAEGRLEEAVARYEELGLRHRADRLLAVLGAAGHTTSPLARELARTIVFDGIPAAELEGLAARSVRTIYHEGEVVQRRFETASELGLVLSGRLSIGKVEAGPGDLFGERALLPDESWVVEAAAVSDLQVLILKPAEVLALGRGRPEVAERVLTLLRQRLRQESALTGVAEPPDVVARVLGLIERRPPGFEILPVQLDQEGLWLLRPQGEASWRVEADPGASPGEAVGRALRDAGLDSTIAHSTSWRYHQGRLVLTYLAIVSSPLAGAGAEEGGSGRRRRLERVPIGRTELARGSAHDAPPRIEVAQVVEHGLRHLSWLSRDDAVIAAALSPAWLARVAEYQPEPFRAL